MKTPAFVPAAFRIATLALTAALLSAAGTLPATEIMSYGGGKGDLNSSHVVGSGHVVSETRDVSGFHGVEQIISGDLIITQGDHEGLVVEGEDNILPLVETKVDKDGILHLGIRKQGGLISYEKELVFKVSVKNLDRLDLATSGQVHVTTLKTEHLNVRLRGSAEVTVARLDAAQLEAAILGSGTLKLAGTARRQEVTVNGSGDYQGRGLQTQDTTVVVNGSGRAQVWADASLEATINGSGDVGYRGRAEPIKRINGSGRMHPLADPS